MLAGTDSPAKELMGFTFPLPFLNNQTYSSNSQGDMHLATLILLLKH